MILRHLVCIPVYNNPETIVDVATECLQISDLPLLIIDDGSDQKVQDLFCAYPKSQNERISFVRFEKNQGKGVALQQAFNWSVQKGFTHLLTIDGDGQHSPKDIPALIEKSLLSPWALIVGDRNMDTANVPNSSTFGKAFSNFWIKYETEKNVSDSQSGYRVYPLFYLQTMRFFRKRYDFEIEVLTRLIWKGVEVLNVPVSVKYFPPEKRVSHFHKWKDNALISVTNTVLVCLSLLNHKTSPIQSALAVGIGVMVGVTPLFGLHTLIVAILAFGLRLNFVYLWLGTQISLPPLVPALLLGVGVIHQIFFNSTPDDSNLLSASWVFSYLTLGLALGLLSSVFVYVLMRQKQSQSGKKKFVQNQKPHIGIHIMDFILRKFGLRPAYLALYFVVPFYYLFHFRTRQSAGEYWRIVRPELHFFQRQKKIFDLIMSFAKQLIDRAYQRNSEELVFDFKTKIPISEVVRELYKNQKGTICVNGHFGGWDLPATLFRHTNSEKKMRAIMYGEEAAFKPEAQKLNQNYQATYYNQESFSIMKIKSDLDQGQTVALMADRPVSKNYELVPFFGKLSLFDSTPFRVAMTCQAQLCYIFCFKMGLKTYSLNLVLRTPESGQGLGFHQKEKLIYSMLQDFVRELESELREYPEQWYNFFPFWSRAVIQQ